MEQTIFLALMFAVAACLECPTYVCNPNLPPETCWLTRDDPDKLVYELRECHGGKICDIYDIMQEAKCKESYSHPIKYPGEYYRNETECINNKYDNKTHRCIGANETSNCTSDEDCDAGLYCTPVNNTCVKTLKEGKVCDMSTKCAPYLVCNKGNCTLQASLENGEKANVEAACRSFFINKEGQCADGPKLIREKMDPRTGPTFCNDGLCKYRLGNETFTEPCTCGYLESGKPLCAPQEGDVSLTNYYEYIKKQSSISDECHISRGALCKRRPTNKLGRLYHNAYVAYENSTRWAIYFDNADCVKQVRNRDYWYSVLHEKEIVYVEPPYTLLKITAVIVAISVAIFSWRYFKKWSEDAELIDKYK